MVGSYILCTLLITMMSPNRQVVYERISAKCEIQQIEHYEVNNFTQYFVDCSKDLKWIEQHPTYSRPLEFWTAKGYGECK